MKNTGPTAAVGPAFSAEPFLPRWRSLAFWDKILYNMAQ
jgi:hypothetical protein